MKHPPSRVQIRQSIGRAIRQRIPRRSSRSFSFQLLLGLIILFVLTTLSASVPALLVIRTQLHRQAGQHLADIQQATASLYRAQLDRLVDQVELLSARPTFRSLATTAAAGEMASYLDAFRTQSGLDVLLYCAPNAAPISLGLATTECPVALPSGDYLLRDRAALVVTDQIQLEDAGEPHTLLAAVWLDEAFLRQMAANTGAEQALLAAQDQRRLVSSQPAMLPRTNTAVAGATQMLQSGQAQTSADSRFLTTVMPLGSPDEQSALLAEIALPIDELRSTEVFASTILIANNYGEMMSVPLYESALMGAALLLLVVVLFFNIMARTVIIRLTARS